MSTRSRQADAARGSALLTSIILISVLSALGVASVLLSSRERQNAAVKSRLDALQACAGAAQAKLWAELSRYGRPYVGSSYNISQVSLPDGTVLTAPSHYDPDLTKQVKDVVLVMDTNVGAWAGDLTNGGAIGAAGSSAFKIVAHCKDAGGRQLEVELGLRFAL